MTFLRKTTQAVTVLLVLLVSTMLVLPPGVDLELCFSKDGHIDFSLNGCQDGALPKVPDMKGPSVYDAAHHGECIDVTVACHTAQELIRTRGRTGSYTSEPEKNPSKTPLFFSESPAHSAGAYPDSNGYPIAFEDFPCFPLISLRTVVLLI